ncbi:type I glyceraldehyde-3-phosphate dehydrogenase [Candidatus Dependentiae bacterium HGW-Dependentiae-1]|nr:MAG: type I glyceraldehyde-3-phosphate dehydrogenase [Candidatus Dependentiae bacterium HGW-Dependentiae-1]
MIRIAINGFGRIGKNFLRVLMSDKSARESIELVAINVGPGILDSVACAVKYDSLMGTFVGEVHQDNDVLVVTPGNFSGSVTTGNTGDDVCRIQLFAERDPEKLPWKSLKVDWVVECSGHFTSRDGAQKHLQAGAQAVLISAPAKGEDINIIPGVNDAAFKKELHKIVSLGSCTTNAFMPMLKVLNDAFSLEHAVMTTIHAYTNTQVLLDVDGEDARRSRAAALNIIPTSTGAQKMLESVLPELAGRVQAVALRVPVAKVSLIDLTVMTKKTLTRQTINSAFLQAARGQMKNIVSVTNEPLVSTDFGGNSHSVIIDSLLTDVCGDRVGKVFGWYDNEWGYSVRLKDFLLRVC